MKIALISLRLLFRAILILLLISLHHGERVIVKMKLNDYAHLRGK